MKKVSIANGNLRLFRISIFKKGLSLLVKSFFKLDQTRDRVSPLYIESRIKGIFALALVGKKLVFHTEIFDYFK